MAQVILKKVTKRYPGDVLAVKEVDLDIGDGEFVVLVGPSGCGKSTTLRMVAGLEDVTEGDLIIGDRRMNDVPPRDRDIAMVFQSYALYPHMTVRENMAFGLKLRKVPKPEIKQRVDEAAKMLDLVEYLDRKPKALSGGQRQRVAMGRAIVRQPSVFLFDEPLSNLDAKLRVQMRIEIAQLHRRLGTTMIYVTHDQVEAMTLADRIAVMSMGLLQQCGPPMEVYHRPRNLFVAGFIGSPAMNFAEGTLRSRDGAVHFVGRGLDVALPERLRKVAETVNSNDFTLGIRPQHILADADDSVAEASVRHVERMGSETFAHLELGDSQVLIARLPGDRPVGVGDSVPFGLEMESTHLFDADGINLLGETGEGE